MRCPSCGSEEIKVIDSRPVPENNSIRRRRECLSCATRFTTYEVMERLPLVVIKKDGSRQTFDRVKLVNGMLRACEKRPVAMQDIQKAAEGRYREALELIKRYDEDSAPAFVNGILNKIARNRGLIADAE